MYLSTLREVLIWYFKMPLPFYCVSCMQECACDKTQFQPSPHLAEVANCLTSEDYSPCKEPIENDPTKVWLLTWGWTPSPVSETDVQRRRHLFVWVFLNIANNPVYIWLEYENYISCASSFLESNMIYFWIVSPGNKSKLLEKSATREKWWEHVSPPWLVLSWSHQSPFRIFLELYLGNSVARFPFKVHQSKMKLGFASPYDVQVVCDDYACVHYDSACLNSF